MISDKSVRLYADAHYDEAEESKVTSSLSLHSRKEDTSSESDTGPSLCLYRKQEEKNTNIKSDTTKLSQDYLSPIVTTVEETKSESQQSSDYEEC